MVRSDPPHKCSNPIGCIFNSYARTSMDASPAEVTAPVAASAGAAEPERDGGELEAVPTAPLAPQTPSDRPEAASAEAVVESPPGVGRIGREPTARPRISAVADPGRDLLDQIMALKSEQKKAKDTKKAITKDLRNANRRRQRLKKRAKALSDQDLLAVISLRNHEKALGRQPSAEGEEDDEESESELDANAATASASSTATSPARPKRRTRAN